MSQATKYSAGSREGKTLLALRAGPMTNGELYERFPSGHSVSALAKAGLAESCDNGWRLTDAGRAACPLRNPTAAAITPPVVAPLKRSPAPVGLPAKTAPQTSVRRPETIATTGGTRMQPAPTNHPTAVDQVRRLLIEVPDGLARKDIIKRTGLADYAVDNAIVNLIKAGKAVRKGYGVVAPAAESVGVMAARLAQPSATAAVAGDPANTASIVSTGPGDPGQTIPEIDFMIHEDGRLVIWYDDEVFVLPPDATHRLCRFLDHIEPLPWSPRLAHETSQLQPLA